MINIPSSIRTKVVNLVDRLYDVWDDKDEFKKTLEELDDTLEQAMKLLPEKLEDAFSYDGYAELFLIANYEKSENLYFYTSGRGSYTASDVVKDLLKRKDKLGEKVLETVYTLIDSDFESVMNDNEDVDESRIDKIYSEFVNDMLNDNEFCQYILEELNKKGIITLYTYEDIREMNLPVSDIKEAFEVDFLEILDMDQDIYYEIKKTHNDREINVYFRFMFK